MKPILFNTEMVQAILEGRKTVTRWVVKPQPKGGHTVHDFDRRFQLEDDGLIYPDDKVFRWDMLEKELNYRWF